MSNIKKVCPKCGKKIKINELERCCPICGEFFGDITNEAVLQYHSEQQEESNIESERNALIRNSKSNFKEAYLKFFSIWGQSFGIALGLGPFAVLGIPFVMSLGMIVMLIIPIAYFFVFPFRLIKFKGESKGDGRFIGISVISLLCCILVIVPISVGVLIILKPVLIFQYLHYWWVVGVILAIGLFIVVFSILSMKIYSRDYFEKVGANKKRENVITKGTVAIIGVILSIALMLISFFAIPSKSYNIANVQEFNILANMPFAGKCDYVLVSDLDFNGKSSKGWDGITYFYGTFDGNGHTISNLRYEGAAKKTNQNSGSSAVNYYSDGFVGINYGTIKNINFNECIFKILYTDSQNTDKAFLGIMTGENGGTIQDCSLKNCFIEYRLKFGKRSGSTYYFDILIGLNNAYKEGYHYFLSGPSLEGNSANNNINYDKEYIADEGYTLIEFNN